MSFDETRRSLLLLASRLRRVSCRNAEASFEGDEPMSTQGSIKRDEARGSWYFVIDTKAPSGRRSQMFRRGFPTKKAAQAALTEIQADLQRGTFVKPTRVTLGRYLEGWLAGLPSSGRRPSTVAGYRGLMECHVLPALGGIELQALNPLHLDGLYSDLLERKRMAMSSVRKVHVVLGKALSDAERKGFIVRNVARLATPPAAAASKPPEMKFWTPAQLSGFLTANAEHHHYPIIHLATMSGLRRGELAALRWSDVDLHGGTVAVRQATAVVKGKPITGDVKTKRSRRVVDVDPGTVAVLKAVAKKQKENRLLMGAGWTDTGLVFTMPSGEAWHPDTITQAFDRLVTPASKDRAFILLKQRPRIRFHDLRHTHASHLLAAGVNVKVVSDRLGHASVAFTLDTYAHVMPGQQADAALAVAALLERSVINP